MRGQEITQEPLGALGGMNSNFVFGEVNGDGLLDVFTYTNPDQTGFGVNIYTLHINNGENSFSPKTVPAVNNASFTLKGMALGDLNQDGTLDIVVGCSGCTGRFSPHWLLLNSGDGSFSEHTNSALSSRHADTPCGSWCDQLYLADVNNDGALDLLADGLYLNTNDGTGGMSLVAGNPASFVSGWGYRAFGDLTGDGKLDCVVEATVYVGDGAGGFAASTTAPGTLVAAMATVIADMDGDGHADLLQVPPPACEDHVCMASGACDTAYVRGSRVHGLQGRSS